MKKRFLLFPMIALLATGCSGGGYNTSANLPAGGQKISEPEAQAEVIDDVFSSLGKFLSNDPAVLATLPDITGMTMNVSIDGHVKVNINDKDEDHENKVSVKADATGECTIAYYINQEAAVPEETFHVGSAAMLEVKGLNFSLDFNQTQKYLFEDQWVEDAMKIKVNIKNLDLGVYYVFDTVKNDGYILVDLSSEAIPTLANDIIDSVLGGSQEIEQIKNAVGTLLQNNKKLVFVQSELVAMLDTYVATLDPEADAQSIEVINQLHPILEGDILSYVHANFSDLLSMIMGQIEMPISMDSIIPMVQEVLPILNPTLVSYGAEEETAYGIGLHATNKSLEKSLGVDIKDVFGVSIDAGLALVFGNRNGLDAEFMAPELIELRASVNTNDVSVKAGIKADFVFNNKSQYVGPTQDFVGGFTANGLEFVQSIMALFGGR